ncbi:MULTISPECIES: inositol monophosphatase family protein [unclassified Rhizobium]|uniref:inositol monophosphatase family protein n=1 Tax=unclassified Rhizobium TaxID=2613769 RepID=UPI00146CBE72|nr:MULTISPECIES: inositol monophosphatase family protein [unclassified Rhizobium]MBD9454984.1 inositol monophosphatase [Rhizobium sp. RHZ02]NMN71525.1 myo-inositol-1(or 4)-monophosphatase [Rhizobium sp. 57MFTsu3.2]
MPAEEPRVERLGSRLAAAEYAAREAGRTLLTHYGRRSRLVIEQKGLNDFVSVADREAEDVIAAILRPAFQTDGFLGEETGRSGSLEADYVWCVDPLDGTTNFLRGAHNWCVSIGLWSKGEPVLGVIYDPLRDELFAGADGIAATIDGAVISTSSTASVDRTSLGLGHNHRVPPETFAKDAQRLFAAGGSFRQVGAGALMLAYVSAGRVDGYFERHMWAWDAIAGLALIKAAGGRVVPYPNLGAPLEQGGLVLASGPALYRDLSDLFEIP